MAREIDLISASNGEHYLLFGMNDSELSSFMIQLWISHIGKRAIDWLQSMSLGFISFMGGDVWVHNSDEVDRCNLFGEQKYSEVGIVLNEQPDVVKLLDSIGIQSNGEWSVESITIPPTLNYPDGMYSKIPKERFQKREGVWRAEFLRNMKTTDGTISPLEAIKGEPLRGQSAYLILRNIDTQQVKLFKVECNMTISKY